MDQSLISHIDATVAAQRLLAHPFYVAWSHGDLTRDALRRYAEQYYHWVKALPTFLSAVHANCEDLPARQAIVQNLVDEEVGAENHAELWLRFCDALGLDRAEVTAVEPVAETQQAIGDFRAVCRESSPAAGLAALYAYESQQPEVMRTKRKGLVARYGVTRGHDYFEVHEALDVEHSATEGRHVERLAGSDRTPILQAVREALRATYTLLDGPQRLRLGASNLR